MARFALLLAVVALSGCAAVTRTVSASDPAAVYETQTTPRGHEAEIALVSGERAVGRIDALRIDSTAWHEGTLRRAVPTSTVVSITTDRRAHLVRRGVLTGAGVGLAAPAGLALIPDDDGDELGAEGGFYVGLVTVPLGALYGVVGGAGEAKRVTYRLEGTAPATTTAPLASAPVGTP